VRAVAFRPVTATAIASEADRLTSLFDQGAQGDEQAFAQFYDATAARAYGLAVRVLRNPALAEEVTQEAYLDAWRLSARYDHSRGSAVGWLLTLVHRRAVDRVRANQAAARRDETHLRLELAAAEFDTTSVTAMGSLEASQVRAALAELSPGQRQAISLAYFDGLTHTEIAARIGAPLGTVKFRIRDGLRKLRSALEATAMPAS
jgi:RNA polymerase sigma-70 factor, ECF subfamily